MLVIEDQGVPAIEPAVDVQPDPHTLDDGVRPVVTGLQKPLDVVPLRRRHQPGGNPRRS